MKLYLQSIQVAQKLFLGISILIMLILPLIIVFNDAVITESVTLNLYNIAHIAVFFVMFIRPLADIFLGIKWIRPLVILRKGIGVFSASIIMSFIFSKIIIDPVGYITSFGTLTYWSLTNYALLAHLADISAILLIVTSNNLSKRILGSFWKRLQKLSYVFFYSSSLYVYLTMGHISVFISMTIITGITLLAYMINKERAIIKARNTNPQPV